MGLMEVKNDFPEKLMGSPAFIPNEVARTVHTGFCDSVLAGCQRGRTTARSIET